MLQFVPGIAYAQRRAPSRDAERNRVEDEGDEPGPDDHARHDAAHLMQTRIRRSRRPTLSLLNAKKRVTDRRLVLNRTRNCRVLNVILSQPYGKRADDEACTFGLVISRYPACVCISHTFQESAIPWYQDTKRYFTKRQEKIKIHLSSTGG